MAPGTSGGRPAIAGAPAHNQGQDQDNQEDRGRKDEKDDQQHEGDERGKERVRSQGREQDRGDCHDRPQPSMTKNLLITAGIALLCGFIGALGYSYIFVSISDKSSSDQSQGEDKSRSKKESSSEKGSGSGGKEESGRESKSQNRKINSIPGSMSAAEGETLMLHVMDLMVRVDRLGERVDRMTRPGHETPSVLQTQSPTMERGIHLLELGQ
jgi:hypothetical protein